MAAIGGGAEQHNIEPVSSGAHFEVRQKNQGVHELVRVNADGKVDKVFKVTTGGAPNQSQESLEKIALTLNKNLRPNQIESIGKGHSLVLSDKSIKHYSSSSHNKNSLIFKTKYSPEFLTSAEKTAAKSGEVGKKELAKPEVQYQSTPPAEQSVQQESIVLETEPDSEDEQVVVTKKPRWKSVSKPSDTTERTQPTPQMGHARAEMKSTKEQDAIIDAALAELSTGSSGVTIEADDPLMHTLLNELEDTAAADAPTEQPAFQDNEPLRKEFKTLWNELNNKENKSDHQKTMLNVLNRTVANNPTGDKEGPVLKGCIKMLKLELGKEQPKAVTPNPFVEPPPHQAL